jgi:hypothetical protein
LCIKLFDFQNSKKLKITNQITNHDKLKLSFGCEFDCVANFLKKKKIEGNKDLGTETPAIFSNENDVV